MSRRVARTVGLAAVLVAAFAPVATAGRAPSVAGETVVVATRTAKMQVYVPRRARISVDVTKSVSIEGRGRLVGVILRENHPTEPDEAGFLRLPAQLGSPVYVWAPTEAVADCTTPLPDPVPPVYSDCSAAKPPAYYDLRRGTYTLYALTDGAPIRVTVRFAGFSGSTELTPRTPVGSGQAPLAASVDAPVAWSAGTRVTTTGTADVFEVAWWKQDESAAGGSGVCAYSDDLLAPAATYPWVPGCPAGSGVSMTEVRNPVEGSWGPAKGGTHGLLGSTSTDGADSLDIGMWTTAQGVRDAAGFAVWLAH